MQPRSRHISPKRITRSENPLAHCENPTSPRLRRAKLRTRTNPLVAGVSAGEESWLVSAFRLPRDDGVRFPDRAAFIAGSFQAFVCDLRPKLLQRPRRRFVRMPFGVVRSPRHVTSLPPMTGIIKKSEAKMSSCSRAWEEDRGQLEGLTFGSSPKSRCNSSLLAKLAKVPGGFSYHPGSS